jgi:hypothetical protein
MMMGQARTTGYLWLLKHKRHIQALQGKWVFLGVLHLLSLWSLSFFLVILHRFIFAWAPSRLRVYHLVSSRRADWLLFITHTLHTNLLLDLLSMTTASYPDSSPANPRNGEGFISSLIYSTMSLSASL